MTKDEELLTECLHTLEDYQRHTGWGHETIKRLQERLLHRDQPTLEEAVKEFFENYLDRIEETDNGKPFNPVQVSCCRALLTAPLGEILTTMRQLSGAKEGTIK